jgi:hypothetical protein
MRRVSARLALTGLVALAATTAYVAPADASRPAKAKERSALTAAVHASKVGGLGQVPESHYRVADQRVSTVSTNWASARLVATPAFRSSFQNAVVVAVRLAGTNQWVVVDLGSADVGCGIAPNKVLADLFQTKTPCPSGGIG